MKIILFVIVLAIFANTLHAQSFRFGLKAGINISNFTGGDFEEVEKKALVGFHGGAYMSIRFLKFTIQPEAMISTQGAKIDSVSGSYNWKITYVNIPVMLQYHFGGGLYIEAGPQVGFPISEDIESSTIEDFANNMDFSIAAGLGIKARSGWGIGGRYAAGVSKVGDIPPVTRINPDFKNAVIQFSVYVPLTH
ncbi:MAG TPA: porin family protein [Chitinophagaceae bacterium]|nr:porin family protein [Chitinophagaceae bacterium]